MLDECITLKEQKVILDREKFQFELQEKQRAQNLSQGLQYLITAYNSLSGCLTPPPSQPLWSSMPHYMPGKSIISSPTGTGAINSRDLLRTVMKMIKFENNINHVAAVLAANDVECDDLRAIGPADAVDLSNHIDELIMLAISYQAINNKKLELWNGKILISTDSLFYGLSVFQESKGAGKMRPKTNSESQKVRLIWKGGNFPLEPPKCLCAYLRGNFPSVSSPPVPPATDHIASGASNSLANDVECDDLGAISLADAVDLMNNKEPEHRNLMPSISSDSLLDGLSIFQESKGAGKMRLETNSESQKVRLSSKGGNCHMEPTQRLSAYLLGNFPSVSSPSVPPATDHIASGASNSLAKDVECDDLGAISPADAVDVMNNKEPEHRNWMTSISSDSLFDGLSIFQESKGAGKMRLETNSESQKVRLSSKGGNCHLEPPQCLSAYLLGNFPSVSSPPVPPATDHIASGASNSLANDVECDDLGAISPADAVDLMNNKEPEHRNCMPSISSDSLSYGLSIFQESKGAGKMRLETNSESQKVSLSSKVRNCRLEPTHLLPFWLLGNFPSVSSSLVPPATNSNAPLAASTRWSSSSARLIALVAGIALFMLIGVGVCYFFCGTRRITETQLPTTMSPSSENSLSVRNFTYQDLARATDDFSSTGLLGQGGFGFVYKGVLPRGEVIAVKQLKPGSSQGEQEFQAEVRTIGHVHHRHVVLLRGYCVCEDQRFLVYEFVPNGTMEFHLHGGSGSPMSWEERFKIAVGTAKGLKYLHEDCKPRIVHRDVKSSNILIGDNFEAKVADFGLAKLFEDNCTHVSTNRAGTFGYMDPEYFSTGRLTEKSDVYSFGVLLLELITGRPPISKAASSSNVNMIEWAILALNSGNYDDLVDPKMTEYKPCEMGRMIDCAAACVRTPAKLRPQMSQVVRDLEGN